MFVQDALLIWNIHLFLRDLDFAGIDGVAQVLGALAIDSAADRVGGTEDFLDSALQLTSVGLEAHSTGNFNNVIQGDVAGVLDWKDPLSITVNTTTKSLQEHLLFLSFLRSRGGSLRALMTKEEAEGTTETWAWRFWMVNWTVTRRPFQSLVPLAISSPTFLGDKPRGPILGASCR